MRRLLPVLALAMAVPASAAELLPPVPLPLAPPPPPLPIAAPDPAPVLAPAPTPAPSGPSGPATASRSKLTDEDAVEEPAARTSARHLGILYGAGPAVLAIDLEIGHFYGFASAPLAEIFVSDSFAMAALGLGGTLPLPRDPRWAFDLFAFGIGGSNAALGYFKPQLMLTVGVGAGFHFTSQKGFTLAFKLPIFGAAIPLDGRNFNDAGERALMFYENSIITLPIVAFGYRF